MIVTLIKLTARDAIDIASDICIYTNKNFVTEELNWAEEGKTPEKPNPKDENVM